MTQQSLWLAAIVALLSAAAAPSASAQTLDIGAARMVDLSHPYNSQTVYWPTSPSRFVLETLAAGETPGGWYYSAYAFSMPEHGGTHLDAPRHFSRQDFAADQVPLSQLIGRTVVIDISAQAARDADYTLTVADVLADEAANGPIPQGAIVLLRTGWSARWPAVKAYLGDDTPGDASNLHFPSYGPAAASFLIKERGATALGIDTASNDPGRSTDFPVHRIMGAANIPGLENLAGLERLPARGATLIALPIKIEGGSGGPVRVVALVPEAIPEQE